MISAVDHHVGRILGCLEELGVWENTIVVYVSDHGEWLGEHLRYGKGYPGNDCVCRVPLLISWQPEGWPNGRPPRSWRRSTSCRPFGTAPACSHHRTSPARH